MVTDDQAYRDSLRCLTGLVPRKELADQRRLAGLAGTGEDGDQPARQPSPEEIEQPPRMESHLDEEYWIINARIQGRFAGTRSVIPRSAGRLPGRAGPLAGSEAADMDQP